jgi:hypothetical protein
MANTGFAAGVWRMDPGARLDHDGYSDIRAGEKTDVRYCPPGIAQGAAASGDAGNKKETTS